MNSTKLYSVIAVLVLLIIVILQNAQAVTMRVLFWSVSISGILLFLILLVSGFAIGYLVARMTRL
jgi:uncharacterized integral membrane protein